MARADFIDQLREYFPSAEATSDGKVIFPYVVQSGKFKGKSLKIAYEVPTDFPMRPPPGPHVSESLWPVKSGGIHPSGGIHKSPLGGDWQYWSRPIRNWNNTVRSVETVLDHLKFLFDTQGE